MDEVSLNTDPTGDEDGDELEIEGDCEYVTQSGTIQGENPMPPSIGMEFDSYNDVYYFYNCYAKEQGFGVRVSNTWYRKSKERYRGKLSCSNAGFKKKSEANRPRPETRTGCPAMIKFRLTETKRWRIIEVEVDHNHLISPATGKIYKSHKNLGVGTKRALQLDSPEDVQKIRLFRTVMVDCEANGSVNLDGEESGRISSNCSNQLKLKPGDSQAIQSFFSKSQLIDPNFFYVVDLNERGCLRNLFWADSRTRATYSCFGDVVSIDTMCFTNGYEVPLVSFVGVNHHGQPVLLGCGLLAGEAIESYTWLFRAWLTCMSGRPPQVVITEQCAILQTAITDVFPRASHCLCLSRIMQKVPEKLGGLFDYDAAKEALTRAVYFSVKPEDFETEWDDMIQRHEINDHKWLQALFEERKRWVPAYLKDVFFAGMFPIQPNEVVSSYFQDSLDKNTPLDIFFEKYDQALRKQYELETTADSDSKNPNPMLNTGCYFEHQLSKLYTNGIMRKFAAEVSGIFSCFCSGPESSENSPIEKYVVSETRDYEVEFNPAEKEVVCGCGGFNFRGFLCRHALAVLGRNGVDEIPARYIVLRWRKDVDRVVRGGCDSGVDVNNAVHRYDELYRCAVRVVEEGGRSRGRYDVAARALGEIMSKLRLGEDDDPDQANTF